jgi:hypothetical protein
MGGSRQQPPRRIEEADFALAGRILGDAIGLKAQLADFLSAQGRGKTRCRITLLIWTLRPR